MARSGFEPRRGHFGLIENGNSWPLLQLTTVTLFVFNPDRTPATLPGTGPSISAESSDGFSAIPVDGGDERLLPVRWRSGLHSSPRVGPGVEAGSFPCVSSLGSSSRPGHLAPFAEFRHCLDLLPPPHPQGPCDPSQA